MSNVGVAILLAVFVLVNVFMVRHEEYFVARAGEETCVLARDEGSCSLIIQEDDESMAMDQKCRRATNALDGVGMYTRTNVYLLDNGRFRTKPGDDSTCTLMMTDDLVQKPNETIHRPYCTKDNSNLFRNETYHNSIISDIHQDGPFCNITFKDTGTDDDMIKYMNDLRTRANAIQENTAL